MIVRLNEERCSTPDVLYVRLGRQKNSLEGIARLLAATSNILAILPSLEKSIKV
jgi:hypothetical protein